LIGKTDVFPMSQGKKALLGVTKVDPNRMKPHFLLIASTPFLPLTGVLPALKAATVYTSNPNIGDFTADVHYPTLSNFLFADTGIPYSPSPVDIARGVRMIGGSTLAGLSGYGWILASFSGAESTIRVFPNIDQITSPSGGFQYSIYGSNDGSDWTPLFDALTVGGTGQPFRLGTFTGTAPTRVNNVLTPGTGIDGTVGYEADFQFSVGYHEYAFGLSTIAMQHGDSMLRLSAVAAVPEIRVENSAFLIAGFAAVNRMVRRKKQPEDI
jgi:hypothetical protein